MTFICASYRRHHYMVHPWQNHRLSLTLLLGDFWAIGFVLHTRGLRIMLGWWQACWWFKGGGAEYARRQVVGK